MRLTVLHSSDILPPLPPQEAGRYARQIGPGVLTPEGQQRLRASSVLISRIGGMGGPAATALVMAGVGRLTFAHGGTLLSPDLNRQTLASESGVGRQRTEAFAERLRSLSHFVTVEAVDHEPDDAEAADLAARADLVISAAPTFAERLRLNAAAVAARKPLVDAAQWGMSGTLVVVEPGRTACLRCLYPETPQFEELFPVVGAISTAIGGLAALEAIKILSGCGRPGYGKLRLMDAYNDVWSHVELTRDVNCPVCKGR